MPVRSLNSSVLKWPDAGTIDRAVRRWASRLLQNREGVLRIGYFGSYARGDWGVGSDLDLIIILESTKQPFMRRGREFDITELPVPADVVVYSKDEWQSLKQQGRFYQTVMGETVWVFDEREISRETAVF